MARIWARGIKWKPLYIRGYIGFRGYRENGKEHVNYYIIWLYSDSQTPVLRKIRRKISFIQNSFQWHLNVCSDCQYIVLKPKSISSELLKSVPTCPTKQSLLRRSPYSRSSEIKSGAYLKPFTNSEHGAKLLYMWNL